LFSSLSAATADEGKIIGFESQTNISAVKN